MEAKWKVEELAAWCCVYGASLRFRFELVPPQADSLSSRFLSSPRQSDVTTLGTSSSQENRPMEVNYCSTLLVPTVFKLKTQSTTESINLYTSTNHSITMASGENAANKLKGALHQGSVCNLIPTMHNL
jgi:hypothetical protein